MDPAPYLTVLFPAYNEEKRIAAAIKETAQYFKDTRFTVEILIVENGTTDKTEQIAAAAALEYLPAANNIIYTYRKSNKGKGAAVRHGLNCARGKFILITDVDLSTPLNQLPKLFRSRLDYPIVIGSRKKKGSKVIGLDMRRRLSSLVYSLMAWPLTPGILDTQCGFKLIHNLAAKDLTEFITIDGFSYDVELLHAAQQRGYKIKEVPVIWIHNENSKINLFRDSVGMARELLSIYGQSKKGRYN